MDLTKILTEEATKIELKNPVALANVELLDKIIELFGPNGEHWTVGRLARNRLGDSVNVKDLTAESYCMVGAYMKVADINNNEAFFSAWNESAALLGMQGSPDTVPNWNNHAEWPEISAKLHERRAYWLAQV